MFGECFSRSIDLFFGINVLEALILLIIRQCVRKKGDKFEPLALKIEKPYGALWL